MIPSEPGAKVRLKDRGDWPSPPGFRFAEARGSAAKWLEFDEVLEGFSGFVYVSIEATGGDAAAYVGDRLCFRSEDVEPVTP